VLTLRRLEIIFLVALVAFVVLQWVVGRILEKFFSKNGDKTENNL